MDGFKLELTVEEPPNLDGTNGTSSITPSSMSVPLIGEEGSEHSSRFLRI